MKKLKPEELSVHIEKGELAPVYLLAGEEGFLIEKAYERLLDRALVGAPRDFNLDVFYAKDAKADDVASQADTLPMMADRRVVVLKEADKLKDPAPLIKYIGSPSPGTVLILLALDPDKAKEAILAKALPEVGIHVHFYPLFDNQVPQWIRSQARGHGYSLDNDAASYMNEMLCGNLALLEAELGKVFNYVGDRKNITYGDVRESVGDFGLPAVYELIDAATGRKTGEALETLARLLREGEEPLKVLGFMANHWRKLADAKERLRKGEPAAQVAKALRLHFRTSNKFLAQAERATDTEVARAFHLFKKADTDLKGSALGERVVMERLVLELSGAGGF